MADLIITERSNIVALADAIREKTGATGSISLGDMISDVEVNIKSDPILQDKSITPTDETQVITADDGYDGLDTVTVNGDTNLKAENIAEGISIFGVEGTHSGGGSEGASVETCTVTITSNRNIVGHLYTIVENGQPSVSYSLTEWPDVTSYGKSLTVDNLVCGTVMVIDFAILAGDWQAGFVTAQTTGGITILNTNGLCTIGMVLRYIFKAPSTARSSASVYVHYDS